MSHSRKAKFLGWRNDKGDLFEVVAGDLCLEEKAGKAMLNLKPGDFLEICTEGHDGHFPHYTIVFEERCYFRRSEIEVFPLAPFNEEDYL